MSRSSVLRGSRRRGVVARSYEGAVACSEEGLWFASPGGSQVLPAPCSPAAFAIARPVGPVPGRTATARSLSSEAAGRTWDPPGDADAFAGRLRSEEQQSSRAAVVDAFAGCPRSGRAAVVDAFAASEVERSARLMRSLGVRRSKESLVVTMRAVATASRPTTLEAQRAQLPPLFRFGALLVRGAPA